MNKIFNDTDGGLLTADNCAVVFIDHQPQMTKKGRKSHEL